MTSDRHGWFETTLGELGTYYNGRGFKKAEWRESGLPIIRIQNLTGTNAKFNHYQGNTEERYTARKGDLLISWAATLGAYIWPGPDAVVNQHIFKVESFIDVDFHKHLLDYKLSELMRKAHGSGMVHITRGVFDAVPVFIPESLEEQRRIVEHLDSHLSRIDAGESLLATTTARARSLRAQLLASLAPSSAPVRTLRSLALSSGYGTSEKCAADGAGVPVARIPNLRSGQIDMADEKRAIDPSVDLSNLMLSEGDLLIVRTNGSKDLIGRASVVQDGVDAAFASYLIRYKFDTTIVRPEWVRVMLDTPAMRRLIEDRAASSAGQYNLGLSKLNTIEIPTPSLEDQDRLIARHSEIEWQSKVLRAQLATSQAQGRVLRSALVASVFQGKRYPISDLALLDNEEEVAYA